jgi:hypothetical protein
MTPFLTEIRPFQPDCSIRSPDPKLTSERSRWHDGHHIAVCLLMALHDDMMMIMIIWGPRYAGVKFNSLFYHNFRLKCPKDNFATPFSVTTGINH